MAVSLATLNAYVDLVEEQLSPVGRLQVNTALSVMEALDEHLSRLRRRLGRSARTGGAPLASSPGTGKSPTRDFQEINPPGLPDAWWVDGQIAHTDHAAYLSDDGWTWREVWHD